MKTAAYYTNDFRDTVVHLLVDGKCKCGFTPNHDDIKVEVKMTKWAIDCEKCDPEE